MLLNIVKQKTFEPPQTQLVSAVPQLTEISVVVSVNIYYHLIIDNTIYITQKNIMVQWNRLFKYTIASNPYHPTKKKCKLQ